MSTAKVKSHDVAGCLCLTLVKLFCIGILDNVQDSFECCDLANIYVYVNFTEYTKLPLYMLMASRIL